MFCFYVYLIWHINTHGARFKDSDRTRASDFAVMVTRLPARGSDPPALRQHFAFFGEVASVAVSTDHHRLLAALHRHQQLKTTWRNLHLEYSRVLRAARAETFNDSGVQLRAERRQASHTRDALLRKLENTWGDMLRARRELREASRSRANCTGHAVVIFKEMSAAAKCVCAHPQP